MDCFWLSRSGDSHMIFNRTPASVAVDVAFGWLPARSVGLRVRYPSTGNPISQVGLLRYPGEPAPIDTPTAPPAGASNHPAKGPQNG